MSGAVFSPVVAEGIQEPWGEGDAAFFGAFSACDAQQHSLAVDVADAQVECFFESESGGVECGEDDSVFQGVGACQEPEDFFGGEYGGQDFGFLSEGDHGHRPVTRQGDPVEKPQGTHGLVEAGPRGFLVFDQMDLVIPHVLGSEQVGGLTEKLREALDVIDVGLDGAGGEVTDLHVLDHALT